MGPSDASVWGFPRIGVPFLGGPFKRILFYSIWGIKGSPISGNTHVWGVEAVRMLRGRSMRINLPLLEIGP